MDYNTDITLNITKSLVEHSAFASPRGPDVTWTVYPNTNTIDSQSSCADISKSCTQWDPWVENGGGAFWSVPMAVDGKLVFDIDINGNSFNIYEPAYAILKKESSNQASLDARSAIMTAPGIVMNPSVQIGWDLGPDGSGGANMPAFGWADDQQTIISTSLALNIDHNGNMFKAISRMEDDDQNLIAKRANIPFGKYYADIAMAFETGSSAGITSGEQTLQALGLPPIADAGVDWRSFDYVSSKPAFDIQNGNWNEYLYWFNPLGGISTVSPQPTYPDHTYADMTQLLSPSVCAAGGPDWNSDKCSAVYNNYYNSMNSTDCAKADKNWKTDVTSLGRPSIVDGAEQYANVKSEGLWRPGFTSMPQAVGCFQVNQDDTYAYWQCQGFSYYPTSIMGQTTKWPGGTDADYNHWDDVPTRRRTLRTDPIGSAGSCYLESSTVNIDSGLIAPNPWPLTKCPRAVPVYQLDPVCHNQFRKCPVPLFSGGKISNIHSDDPTFIPAANWFNDFLSEVVIPAAVQQYGSKTDPSYISYMKQKTWDDYFNKLYKLFTADVPDLKAATLYCNTDYYLSYFLPVQIIEENIVVNWWDGWNALGITKQRIVEMCIGAVPVGYMLDKYNAVFLMPLYFAGGFLSMIYYNNYTNTGFWDNINELIAVVEGFIADAKVIWISTEKKWETAQTWLEHALWYTAITGVGLGLTGLAMLETNSWLGAVAMEIEADEFLVGIGLTLLADSLYAIINGDMFKLWAMIIKNGASDLWNGISDAFTCAFNGTC